MSNSEKLEPNVEGADPNSVDAIRLASERVYKRMGCQELYSRVTGNEVVIDVDGNEIPEVQEVVRRALSDGFYITVDGIQCPISEEKLGTLGVERCNRMTRAILDKLGYF